MKPDECITYSQSQKTAHFSQKEKQIILRKSGTQLSLAYRQEVVSSISGDATAVCK